MRVRFVGLVALMALMLASCGGASPEAGGPSEGIQVHGDWTIDIYNEDGSLDEHVEFSNDLTDSAPETLATFFARTRTIGSWAIVLNDTSGQDICFDQCFIEEEGARFAGLAESTDLMVEYVSTPSPRVRLSGSVVAEEDGATNDVSTVNYTCDPTVATSDCPGLSESTIRSITQTFLPERKTISSGQTVQVVVDISFNTDASG